MSNRLLSILTLLVFFGLIIGFVTYSGLGSKKPLAIEYAPSDISSTARIYAGDILLSTHECHLSPCQIEYRYKKDLTLTLTASGYEVSSAPIITDTVSIDLLPQTQHLATQDSLSGASISSESLIIPLDIIAQGNNSSLLVSTGSTSILIPIDSGRISFAYISRSSGILHIITNDGLVQADTSGDIIETLSTPHPIAHDMVSYRDGAIILSRSLEADGSRPIEYRDSRSVQMLARVGASIVALEVRGDTLYYYDESTKLWQYIRLP